MINSSNNKNVMVIVYKTQLGQQGNEDNRKAKYVCNSPLSSPILEEISVPPSIPPPPRSGYENTGVILDSKS